MRALTQEEVRFVAGGDALGEAMIDVGEGLIAYAPVVNVLPKYGKIASSAMTTVGAVLVTQGKKRNQTTDPSPIGGGVGSGGEGGANPGGGGGTSLPGSGTGGGTGGGGSQTGCGSGDPDCTIIWHPT